MNKWMKLIIGVMLIVFFTSIYGEIETITLQQGVDGYSDCIDTYLVGPDEINGGIDTVPKADAAELTLHGYH